MAEILGLRQIGQEVLSCLFLGAVLGAVRALFPRKGRAAFLPDLLLVGGVLLALQMYTASLSEGGVLRWYFWVAAFLSVAVVEAVLSVPVQAAEKLLWKLAHLPLKIALRFTRPLLQRAKVRKMQRKARRDEKRTAKNPKKNLPKESRMLYNSNVSK